jgi:hypothetical protein
MDIERKVAAPNLDLISASPPYHNDKIRSGEALYTIDLKV